MPSPIVAQIAATASTISHTGTPESLCDTGAACGAGPLGQAGVELVVAHGGDPVGVLLEVRVREVRRLLEHVLALADVHGAVDVDDHLLREVVAPDDPGHGQR